ncbi:MAG: ion transporter [Oscillospiraceae bacterium]|nr:ion transporter [Oscillospiraceae bacterium]
MKHNRKEWLQRRRRISEIIEVGTAGDWVSKGYDLISTLIVIINISVTVLYTFDQMELQYGDTLLLIESLTVFFFAVDYILRVWTARFLYPTIPEKRAIRKYMLSLTGIIDLLSWLPYYLPVFFPAGAAVFRMLRVVRIFRLFQINAYYDSLNVIGEVISSKRQQLMSSVFIILVLMMASSLCMYSLEHEAQPEVFSNAFSGIWWSVSTLLTVGYGDIYPITYVGKFVGIIITFLGVGMVAIPTGIISAGFVDQYSRLKRMSEYAREDDVQFIKIHLRREDKWTGKTIMELELPHGVIVAMIRRGRESIVPRGDVMLKANDTIILGAEALKDDTHIDLKEIVLQKMHPWNGQRIMDLNIPRQTFIIMIKRNGRVIVPKGDRTLLEGDTLIVYSQEKIAEVSSIIEL